MNRRQKIIVSVTGIFLVLLLLVGLTYAYFLTKITGNTNPNSISVSTANLALVYGDGNGIITAENIEPSSTPFATKTFTVTNTGNDETDYVVVIEGVNVSWANDVYETNEEGVSEKIHSQGDPAEFTSNDFTYTLDCKVYSNEEYEKYQKDPTTATSKGTCNGVSSDTIFPINNGILVGNTSKENGETHIYELKVTYKDTNINQSADMNKAMVAKVDIKNIIDINPYSSDTTSLAYNIINNAVGLTIEEKESGYAELVATPPTSVANEISASEESILSITQDDFGVSYYYRGAVKNNYLEFNGMCWRIVRIEGDGSIKITLAAQKQCSQITSADTGSAFIGTGDYGYTTNSNGQYFANYESSSDTSMKSRLNKFLNGGSFDSYNNDGDTETKTYTAWSQTNLDKLKSEEVCIGDTESAYTSAGVLMSEAEKQSAISNWSSYYYKNYIRMYTDKVASLMCDTSGNKTTSAKVYPLTVDEVVFAGGKPGTDNYTFYLRDNASSNWWWTISPAYFYGNYDFAIYVNGDGFVEYGDSVNSDGGSLRPAVSLIEGTTITSGDGSITNPYIVG